jgi:hypothetical protein
MGAARVRCLRSDRVRVAVPCFQHGPSPVYTLAGRSDASAHQKSRADDRSLNLRLPARFGDTQAPPLTACTAS